MKVTEEIHDFEGSQLEMADIYPKSEIYPGVEYGLSVVIVKDPATCNIISTFGEEDFGIMMDKESAIRLANFILKAFKQSNLKIIT